MDEKIRINKYLSDAGVCSRREADRLTEAGRVTVRGTVVSTGEKIFPDEEICIDGKPIFINQEGSSAVPNSSAMK